MDMRILQPPITKEYDLLFKLLNHNLAAVSIYRGLSKVPVFIGSDKTWLVTRVNHRILVSGNYMESEAVKTIQRVVDEGVKAGSSGFVLYYPLNAEKVEIGEYIKGVNPYPNWRNYYRLELEKTGYHVDIPENYKVEQITWDLLEKDYENTDLVMEEMLSERLSLDAFMEKSFGFCSVQGDIITSWCMSEYNVNKEFEVGIETHKDHRRKGLAVQTARACFHHGVKNSYKFVGWHCWKNNDASNKTAIKLGFKYVIEYPVEYLEAT